MDFRRFFAELTGDKCPRPWQYDLSIRSDCGNRLIRIPTGFGKTLGVLAAWIWHRVHRGDEGWPRRLVWCLPMRVLVEQVEGEVRSALRRLGVLWDGRSSHVGKVGVHLLMGGADAGRWHIHPECNAVLIGTQDMLLSRAMNRGYASHRARWPMEFGLLNQDALWVMDEVQLMDVGLATSGQLQVFRDEDRNASKTLRPCCTWWMSATLQRSWLAKSPDTVGLIEELAGNTHRIARHDRTGHLWDDVTKSLEIVHIPNARALARDVSRYHRDRGCGQRGPTLVVLNTVKRAIEMWKALSVDKALKRTGVDIRLAHSRFRPIERASWGDAFLNRAVCTPGINRIIVSTQVIEAGVDISVPLLVTELAPWPSLVQRFGRCARGGGAGHVIVADFEHGSDKKAAPYFLDELDASRKACAALRDVAPFHLDRFEEKNEVLLSRLYPYKPKHLLLRHELNELFDTSADLSGADVDISRFIRSGAERDVHVFWTEIDGDDPTASIKPRRAELCAVPFLKVREWLCGTGKSESLQRKVRAWVWDWLNREWRRARRRDIYPGQTILVESSVGGYDEERGWDPESSDAVGPVRSDEARNYTSRPCWKRHGDDWHLGERRVRALPPEDHADDAEDDESISVTDGWQTIASHGLQVANEAERIAARVAPGKARLLHLAGRWHDLGKAHAAFQGSIQADNRPKRDDIAKAPDIAWPCSTGNMYRIDATDQRRGFRHELASALGLFGVLQRHEPQHQALLGPWREWFECMEETTAADDPVRGPDAVEPTAIEQEILDLGSRDFDLLAYLVCAHHGKVRMTWHVSPADQEADDRRLRIRGVREGDVLPQVSLVGADGEFHRLPATRLDLSPSQAGLSFRTGRSWTERVLNLVEQHGPFTLGWMESLLRAGDLRASGKPTMDRLLLEKENENVTYALDEGHRALARPSGGGAPPPPLGSDSPSRGELHGDGGGAGGREVDPGTTRPPHSATRYIKTAAGILSYRQMAPLHAERVADAEVAIVNRVLPVMSFYDL